MTAKQTNQLLSILESKEKTEANAQANKIQQATLQEQASKFYSKAKAVAKDLNKLDIYTRQISGTLKDLKSNQNSLINSVTKVSILKDMYKSTLSHLENEFKNNPEKLLDAKESFFSSITGHKATNKAVYNKMLEMQQHEVAAPKAKEALAASISYKTGMGLGDAKFKLAQLANKVDLMKSGKNTQEIKESFNQLIDQIDTSKTESFTFELWPAYCNMKGSPLAFLNSDCWVRRTEATHTKLGLSDKIIDYFNNHYTASPEFAEFLQTFGSITYRNNDHSRHHLENAIEKSAKELLENKYLGVYAYETDQIKTELFRFAIESIKSTGIPDTRPKALNAKFEEYVEDAVLSNSLVNIDLLANINDGDSITDKANTYLEELNKNLEKLTCYSNNSSQFRDSSKLKETIANCEAKFSDATMFDDAILHHIKTVYGQCETANQ